MKSKIFRLIVTIMIFLLFIIVNIFPASTVISKENEYKPTGRFVHLQSYLKWSFNASDLSEPIVPLGKKRTVSIYFDYGVNYGGYFKNLAKLLLQYYRNRQVNIKLEIIDYSPWCTPNLFTDTITTVVGEAEQTGLLVYLDLELDFDAPAYAAGFVELKATVPKIGLIQGYNNTYTIEFTPAYLPIIKPETPEGNYKLIGPMDTASIPIEIENLGNGRTKVRLQVTGIHGSEDWTATVTEEIYLDVGKDSKGIAYLTIKPPKYIGYHDESVAISVELIPQYALGTERGIPQYVDILVDCRGSLGTEEKGFEFDTTYLLILIIIILIIAIIVIQLINRKK